MDTNQNSIEGNILWESEMSKKGKLTRLWFKRWVLFTSIGYIYSRHFGSKAHPRKHAKIIYKIEPNSILHYSTETCILEIKTGNSRLFKLKAQNSAILQKWCQCIQQYLDQSNPNKQDLLLAEEKKRKSLFVNTEEANKETTFIITEPTPVGKRDIDIPASSLRQKVLNKQGKDYSHESASVIQKEYQATRSTREANKESINHTLSYSPAQNQDQCPSSQTRQLLTNTTIHHSSKEPTRASCDINQQYPVVLATPSLFKAFNLLEISKKKRRAMSTGNILDSSFHSIQFFNPEFDQTTEEKEPENIRSILHNRFLEALDASILDMKKDIILVLDKPGLKFINQLILNKAELTQFGITIIQSLHSTKRHAYPESHAVFIIDPTYQEKGITSFDLFILDLTSSPKQFKSGSLLLLTSISLELEQTKIWNNLLLLQSLSLPPAVIGGNVEIISDDLILLNSFIPNHLFFMPTHPDFSKAMNRIALLLCSFLISINEYPYFRFDPDCSISGQIAASTFLYLDDQIRNDADFWFRGCIDIQNRSTVLILSRQSDFITPLLHSVAYEAMFHDYLHISHDGKVSINPHSLLTFLSGGLPSSLDMKESNELWKIIRDMRIEHARTILQEAMERCEMSLQLSNQKCSPIRSLAMVSKNLENSLSFRESCDKHISILNVLQRIDDLFHLKQLCSLEQTIASTLLPSGKSLSINEILSMIERFLTELSLGELEKVRLLLLTLFSFPSIFLSKEWLSLKQIANIQNIEYQQALRSAEFLIDNTKQTVYSSSYREKTAKHLDHSNTLEDLIYIRNTPYISSLLQMIRDGYLSRNDYPFLLKPPMNYDVKDTKPKEVVSEEVRCDFVPKQKRRLIVVIIGGLTFTELHHLRTLAKEMKQKLVLVTTSLITPQSFIKSLSEIDLEFA